MMHKLCMKRRTFAGVVCEQEVYPVADRIHGRASDKPCLRFENDEERQAHKDGISRRKFQRLVNTNFTPESVYSTLTFDDEHEVHTFLDAKRLRNNYIRRLLYAYPDARLVIVMGRGKTTNRIHMHMISDGVPEDVLRDKWQYGKVIETRHLRAHVYYNGIDHGQDYTGLANYLFDHWTPEQGGHRWKQTRSLRQPEREKAKPVLRRYSEKHPPRAPKGYTLVECSITPYGYQLYKYVRIPETQRTGSRR